jgi:hypothetical protein
MDYAGALNLHDGGGAAPHPPNKIAEKMRSSRKYFDESYTKRFQINPQPQAHPIKQEDNNIVYSSILYESNVPLFTKYQANLLASKFILAKQYPPVSLTSDSTLFSAQAYGNGTYNRIVCRAGTPPFASKCKRRARLLSPVSAPFASKCFRQ